MLNPLSNISLRKRLHFGGWGAATQDYEDESMYPVATTTEECHRSSLTEQDSFGENQSDSANTVEHNVSPRGPCVRVGCGFQADISRLYEGDDVDEDTKRGELVWDPSALSPQTVNTFLSETQDPEAPPSELSSLPVPRQQIVTQEDVLTTLHRSGYDVDKAKQGSWNRREVETFSHAMESYYKRFHAIRKLFFPYKTTQEVVEYYYFWKVTTDVEPQRDLDEVSSQSEEYDELSLQTSSSQIAKRKRDTMHDSFNGDPLLGGWGAYDNTSLNRSAEFTPCHEEGPPLKRSRSEDFKMSTDSFFSREVDGLGHSQLPNYKGHYTTPSHDIFSNSSELGSWADFLTFPTYSPVSSIPEVDNFLDPVVGSLDSLGSIDGLDNLHSSRGNDYDTFSGSSSLT